MCQGNWEINKDEKSDFLVHKNVAFDLENDEFKLQLEKEMDKSIIPNQPLVNGHYIIGCVFKELHRRKRIINFTIIR